jgi:ADP-heptose:LPS heptosyltransferase
VKVLAIRLGRFGDIVLLLPALTLLKARMPECHLSLLTDTRWAPLAGMCPAIDEVIPVDRLEMRDGSSGRAIAGVMRLMSDLRRRGFDAVIDCHGFRETNLLAWWSGAPQRWGLKRFDQSFLGFCFNRPPVLEDKNLHASESFLRLIRNFAPVDNHIPPQAPLVIPKDALLWVSESMPASSLAVLFVDAPVPERIWPLNRFAVVGEHIAKSYRASVVAVGRNARLLEPSADIRVLSDLSIPRLAAVISKARILVSNDTGPMHLGPALRVPTVGIFSVGIPTHFRPTGAADRCVHGNPIETVEVDEVVAAVEEVWESSDRADFRR